MQDIIRKEKSDNASGNSRRNVTLERWREGARKEKTSVRGLNRDTREGKSVTLNSWREKAREEKNKRRNTVVTAGVNDLESWRDRARQDTGNNIEREIVPIRGQEKNILSELDNRDDYVKVKNTTFSGVDFIIRKGTNTVSNNLYMRETNYEVEVRTSPDVGDLTIAGFIANLWDVFDTIFSGFCLYQILC